MTYLDNLVLLHNQYRKNIGLDILYSDARLIRFSHNHSNWMSQNRKLIHSDIKQILKIGYNQVAENIAFGEESEEQVFNKWIKSFRHRKNIINASYNKIGCSASKDNNNQLYWVVIFAQM